MSTSTRFHKRFGFAKAADFRWYLLAAIPMLVFVLVRSPIVSVKGHMCNPLSEKAAPGECYWHTLSWSRYQIGMYIHIWSVFPATLIALTQFIPAIRVRRPKVHRTLGKVCWVLGLTAAVSALMICDRSFGGTLPTKLATCILATMCFTGHYKAYEAIRGCRLHKHREWMLRTWMWMGSILTMRPLVGIWAMAISFLAKQDAGLNIELPCPQIFYALTNGPNIGSLRRKPDFFSTYGWICSPGVAMMSSPSTVLAQPTTSPLGGLEAVLTNAKAVITGNILTGRTDSVMAALDLSFGPAFLIGIAVNAIIAEWYLRRTQPEALRLQKLGVIKERLAKQKGDVVVKPAEEHISKQSIRLPEPEDVRSSFSLWK